MASKIYEQAKQLQDYMVGMRREFHMHPELSTKEFETQKRLMRELDAIGIPYRKVGNTSLVATLNAGKGKVVALRSDTDALPVIEKNEEEYNSQNEGVMHACGHDAHMAMLLGAAKILKSMEAEIPGEVRFIFQEAEEVFSGARSVIADGGLDGVSAIFGMHNMPMTPSGTVEVNPGYKMAGCDTIRLKFEGVSGHGSMPHKAKDTFTPAALFALDLQNIVTKNVDCQKPIVLNVGRFHSGTKANIVPKYTEVDISMRYFHDDARQTVHEALVRHAQALAAMYETTVEINFVAAESTPSLKNDETLALLAGKIADDLLGPGKNYKTPLLMGSEDFSCYLEKVPGTFLNLGSYNPEAGSVFFPHHECFKVDEGIFPLGAAFHAEFAVRYLESAK